MLFVFFALMCLLIFLVDFSNSAAVNSVKSLTNEERVSFIESLGYKVEPECVEAKEIIIPIEFSDVYKRYNSLQKKAGYNLENHKGETVTLYKYVLENSQEPVYVNLIVADGQIVGGDIQESALGGKMLPLSKNVN